MPLHFPLLIHNPSPTPCTPFLILLVLFSSLCNHCLALSFTCCPTCSTTTSSTNSTSTTTSTSTSSSSSSSSSSIPLSTPTSLPWFDLQLSV
ncbi:unnamed protein product [Closterium sp. NIES-53]